MAHQQITHIARLLSVFLILAGIYSTAAEDNYILRYKPGSSNFSEAFLQEQFLRVMKDEFPLIEVEDVQSCSCRGYACGCCLHFKLMFIDENACVNIKFLPDEIGIELTVTLNGVTYIDKKISVMNPPPICFGIPGFHKLAGICLRLYNMAIKDRHFVGCAKLEVYFAHKLIFGYNMGCFHIPPGKGMEMITERELKFKGALLGLP